MASSQQLLTELFEGLEGSGASIDLSAVFLERKMDGEC